METEYCAYCDRPREGVLIWYEFFLQTRDEVFHSQVCEGCLYLLESEYGDDPTAVLKVWPA